MEPYKAYEKAMKIINIIYICEQRSAYINFNDITSSEMIKIILDLFYVYNSDNIIINLTEFDAKIINDAAQSETSIYCMQYFDCNDCYIKDITNAIKSINLTLKNHIRGTDILQHCYLIYFLSFYKFKPKINTDDWENF